MSSPKIVLLLASLLGATGVGLGAFGAHALKSRVDADLLAIWQTAVQYHLLHAVALLVIAALLPTRPSLALAGWLFVGGVLVFSGSLYALVLSGVRVLGAVTPFGGLGLIAGWLATAWAALR
jgi:uncharacterized membrane protein YgdD (TMEM256/DUF423 family)